MAEVRLDTVTKVYDDAQGTEVAVEELDLDIEEGEFVVIVGPSGCGKSTTLRMIAGLETVTQGDIWIGDRVVNDLAPKNRDIAMVFQNYALYPHKSVRENMAYGLKLSTDLSKEEIRRRVEETAEMMGITELLDKKPGALSGGQQQRVATGRAIVREPAVFLFDEPLSNLDAKLRTHMRTELARLHTELGITSIYVTHDQEEAMTLADRIVILNDGRLQQVGTPKEVYHNPANEFVADFIGTPSINLFPVEHTTDGEGSDTLVNAGFEYDLSGSLSSTIGDKASSSFTLGVRPENVRVLEDGEDDPNAIEATVDVVEVMGSTNILYLDIAGQELRVRVESGIEPSPDDRIGVTFPEESIYLFDDEGIERLRSEPVESEPAAA